MLFACACVLSCFTCVWLFVTVWTVATSLPCPWNFPGKNTGVGCHPFFQGICLTQGLNVHLLCLLHWQEGSLPLASPGEPYMHVGIFKPWCWLQSFREKMRITKGRGVFATLDTEQHWRINKMDWGGMPSKESQKTEISEKSRERTVPVK